MAHYLISGLRVESDLDLPGAIAAPDGAAAPDIVPDIVILAGPVPTSLDHADQHGPNWQMAGDAFLLRVPDVVRMLLIGGQHLTWQCEGATRPEDAVIFVAASGIGLLLHQRGRAVLHASAVAVDGRAMLFCGPSGAGKSTIAAMLARRGHDLLSDDQCVLSGLGQGTPMVHPDGRAMKLWRQAIERLQLDRRSGAAVRESIAKFYVEPDSTSAAALPLGGIYVLRDARGPDIIADGTPIALHRLNLPDAAQEVRRNAYRPGMVKRLGQDGLYLQAAAAAVQAGGVWRLFRPMDFGMMDAVIDRLAAHWECLPERPEPRG